MDELKAAENNENRKVVTANIRELNSGWLIASFLLIALIANAIVAFVYVVAHVALHLKVPESKLGISKALWFIAIFSFSLTQCAFINGKSKFESHPEVQAWLSHSWRHEGKVDNYHRLIGQGFVPSEGESSYSLFYRSEDDVFLEFEQQVHHAVDRPSKCEALKADPSSTVHVGGLYTHEQHKLPAEKYCVYLHGEPSLVRVRVSDPNAVHLILKLMLTGKMATIDQLYLHPNGLPEQLEVLGYPYLPSN
ncbi:hypothetical protein A3K86_20215 [Photobacterium jeanii]|uniref:Uncharacterized protein n=1 Tax=Photobacterium jeanii TaxID=858640 RepID=A0A178K3J1_9GAMM|nr:hypothetical protein [Photobacterium jeanii]OAN11283.1 hypothetical protein A3K86_20215 [Photobacterium jeanii]PST90803.1 hypothetical protein C9I91_09325 [Photobacterium jeanii]